MPQHIFQMRIIRVRQITEEAVFEVVAPDRDSAIELAATTPLHDSAYKYRDHEDVRADVAAIWLGEAKHTVKNRAFTFGFSVNTDRDDEPGREIPASILRTRLIETINNMSDDELAENVGPSFDDYPVETADFLPHSIEAIHP